MAGRAHRAGGLGSARHLHRRRRADGEHDQLRAADRNPTSLSEARELRIYRLTLDRLSGGRVRVKIVSGQDDLAAYGDQVHRYARTKEFVRLVRLKAQGGSAYAKTSDNGHKLTKYFCTNCGSTLFTRPEKLQSLVVIRAGTLDDRSVLTPQLRMDVSRAPAWDRADEAVRSSPRWPPLGYGYRTSWQDSSQRVLLAGPGVSGGLDDQNHCFDC